MWGTGWRSDRPGGQYKSLEEELLRVMSVAAVEGAGTEAGEA